MKMQTNNVSKQSRRLLEESSLANGKMTLIEDRLLSGRVWWRRSLPRQLSPESNNGRPWAETTTPAPLLVTRSRLRGANTSIALLHAVP